MKLRKTSDTAKNSENKIPKRSSWWTRVFTSFALVSALSWCGDFPNGEIIGNPGTKTEKFNVTYEFFEWSAWSTIVKNDVLIRKNWEIYEWQIEQKNWWLKKNKKIQSNNVDNLFQQVSNELDSEQITEETRQNKDDKVAKAKEFFNDSILNNPNPTNREIRIKYKKK